MKGTIYIALGYGGFLYLHTFPTQLSPAFAHPSTLCLCAPPPPPQQQQTMFGEGESRGMPFTINGDAVRAFHLFFSQCALLIDYVFHSFPHQLGISVRLYFLLRELSWRNPKIWHEFIFLHAFFLIYFSWVVIRCDSVVDLFFLSCNSTWFGHFRNVY